MSTAFADWVGAHVKILFLDGNLQTGEERHFDGVINGKDDDFIFMKTDDGKNVSVGKRFVVKVIETPSRSA